MCKFCCWQRTPKLGNISLDGTKIQADASKSKAVSYKRLGELESYYQINPQLSIHYDLMDFVAALVAGRVASSEDKAAAWQKAIDLYQRPFLQGHNEGWIIRRRQEYQTGYVEALSEMAALRLHENRPEHALTLLQRAVGEDATRQDLHRQVMSLYAELGRRSEAASHYQRLQESLRERNLAIETETKQLYGELMS